MLGDSTAYGVGADKPEESLAGRVAAYAGMTYVENRASSGAVTKDLRGQIEAATLERYDVILIQIGGNDIIQFHNPKRSADELELALRALPKAEKVVILSAGDVGGATLFPSPITWIHSWLNKKYHLSFTHAVARAGVGEYINLGLSPSTQIITNEPEIYLAADGLHPSSAGYGLWFEEVVPRL